MTENPLPLETQKEPGAFRLIATLGIAGFLSGLLLVAVYLYTRPIIAENKAEALRVAIFEVLPQASRYQAMTRAGDGLRALTEEEAESKEEVIYFGYNPADELVGVAIPGAEAGYQDLIHGIYGYRPDLKMIIGFKVLESKETPGLGDKIFKDQDFRENFRRLLTEPGIEVVKKGKKTAPNQVEGITGATISSNAVGRLLQQAHQQWQQAIDLYLEQEQTKMSSYEGN